MARTALAEGTHGRIAYYWQNSDGDWIKLAAGARFPAGRPCRLKTQYRPRGSDDPRTLQRDGATKGEAERKLNQAISAFDAEAERKATAHTRVTLAEAAEVWLAKVRKDKRRSAATKDQYERNWNRLFTMKAGDELKHYAAGIELAGKTLAEVNTVPVLRDFLAGVADDRGEGTAKTVRNLLSGIIGLAVEDGLASVNATRSLKPVKAAKPKATTRDIRRALTRDELATLLTVADGHPRARAQDVSDIVAFVAMTGVRRGEALAVRWEDVDLEAATVHIHGTKTAGSDRVLAMPPGLVTRLAARAEKGTDGLVFPSPGRTYQTADGREVALRVDREKVRDERNVARVFRDVFDAAGLAWATPHSLRRTAATLLLEAGQSVTVAQAVLGHATADTTLRFYALKRAEPNSTAAAVLNI